MVVVVLAVWHCFDSQPAAVPSQAAYYSVLRSGQCDVVQWCAAARDATVLVALSDVPSATVLVALSDVPSASPCSFVQRPQRYCPCGFVRRPQHYCPCGFVRRPQR